MKAVEPLKLTYSASDLDFLVEATTPAAKNKDLIKDAIRGDETFRQAIVADDRVVQEVLRDDLPFVRISPTLYFEVLLRRAKKELETATYTTERTGRSTVPVFDTPEVLGLLSRPGVIDYLAQMMASFTKVESYTIPVRVRHGVWRKVRFSDADLESLVRRCAELDEPERLAYYKRIADLCLLILGVFPEHAPAIISGPWTTRATRLTTADYENEGRRFYKLAGEHPEAQALHLAEVFRLLHARLNAAKKPLNFISGHYLGFKRQQLFAAGA